MNTPNCSVRMQVFRATFSKSKLNQGSNSPTWPATPFIKHFAKEAKPSHSHKSLLQSSGPCQSTQRSVLCTQGRASLNGRYSYPYNKKTIPQSTWTKEPIWNHTGNLNFNVFGFSGVCFYHLNSIIYLSLFLFCVFVCWNILSRPKFCLHMYNKIQEDNYHMAIVSYLRFISIYISHWYDHKKNNLLIESLAFL